MNINTLLRIVTLLAALGIATLVRASTIQFSLTNYSIAEDAGTIILTVQRLDDVNTVVSVDYATINGTATPGADYTDVSGSLVFQAGETNKAFTIPILNDPLVEPLEIFQVTLGNPSAGAVLGDISNATVRITDNDKGLAFEFASYWGREDEGSVLIGVVRDDDGNFPASVEYFTADGTASAGQDYTAIPGVLNFAAGEKVKLFTIEILNDGLKELNEKFVLYLTNATGVVLGTQKTAALTIRANDPGLEFEFDQYSVQETEGELTVKVLRGNDKELGPLTVNYASGNLTAIAGRSYLETKGTLAFAQGEMQRTIAVPILYADQSGQDLQFRLLLSNSSSGAGLGSKSRATITILDTTGTTAPGFDEIAVQPDRSVQLMLGGNVHKRFAPYFSIYPIVSSQDLIRWSPLVSLVRTNSSTDALAFSAHAAQPSDQRFYQMRTNHLIAPSRPPTGSFAIGRIDRLLTDPSRRNRYAISTNGSFMVTIWYPALREAGQVPTPYRDLQIAQQDPYGFGANWVDRVPYMTGYSIRGARFATNQTSYPVVLFSHGHNGQREEGDDKAEDLASHGFVVLAPDHNDNIATVFPDGTFLKGLEGRDTDSTLRDRVRDLAFMMDQLEEWNQSDAFLAGWFDLARVAALGYSRGGPTAGEFCRVDPRCKAAILLDPGAWSGDLLQLGLSKPSLTMRAADNSELGVFSKSNRDAYWFQIRWADHFDFHSLSWFLKDPDFGASREASRTINAYILWFLNKYLMGNDAPLPALADYPRVFNFKQK